MKKKDQNGDTPATSHDLAILGGHLSSRIDDVEQTLSSRLDDVQDDIHVVKEEQASQRYILESILNVVQSIEGRNQEIKGDHEQIEKHEDRITAVEVQVRMLQK